MDRPQLTRGQRALAVTVVTGTGFIAMIGFVGSYAAVRDLADREGFGWFSWVFPVGVDVGITVMISLDLLLTWLRIPLPLIRYIAWLFTAATVVFNAATAWPNPLATGMHAVVPLMFIAGVEAARWSIGKLAEIVADTYMERTRFGRWVLAPVATFRLWRRRILWELRSNSEAIEMERRRLVFRARLKHAYGRRWRSKAPVELVLMLKLANLGEKLPAFRLQLADAQAQKFLGEAEPERPAPSLEEGSPERAAAHQSPVSESVALPAPRSETAAQLVAEQEESVLLEQEDPAVSGEREFLEEAEDTDGIPDTAVLPEPDTLAVDPEPVFDAEEENTTGVPGTAGLDLFPYVTGVEQPAFGPLPQLTAAGQRYYDGFVDFTRTKHTFPNGQELSDWLAQQGVTRDGAPLSPGGLRRYLPDFRKLYSAQHHSHRAAADPELAPQPQGAEVY